MVLFRFFVCFLALLSSIEAYEDIPDCYKSLERNFFNRKDLYQAFDMYPDMIFPSTWDAIYQDLKFQSQYIPDRVKEEAARLDPNPLEHPFNSKKSLEILKGVLFTAFKGSVTKYTVLRYDESFEIMFEFLMEQNEYEWRLCASKKR